MLLLAVLGRTLSISCADAVNCLSCKIYNGTTYGCLQCLTGYQIYADSSSKINHCICAAGTYPDGFHVESGAGYLNSTAGCRTCHVECKLCLGPSNNRCTFCDANLEFILLGTSVVTPLNLNFTYGNCNCPLGTFFAGGATPCTACNNQCAACLKSALCLTCNTGYWNNAGTCTACFTNCRSCSSSLFCLQCNANFGVNYNNTSCFCLDGYFGTATCTACTAPCLTCSGTGTACTSCDLTKGLILDKFSSCGCDVGFYTTATVCMQCLIYCSKCTTANDCQICASGYALIANSCPPCHYSCLSCLSSTDKTGCSSCVSANNRQLVVSVCVCNIGFFDGGVSACNACVGCQTCTSLTKCLSCNVGSFLTVQKQCSACSNNCVSCSSYSMCTGCGSGMLLIKGQCLCPIGFFLTSTTSCASCDSTCQSCNGISPQSCLTCASNFSLVSMRCICQGGTLYTSSSNSCTACSAPCLTCVGSISTCASCSPSFILATGACTACSNLCLLCINSVNNCVSCTVSSLRLLTGSGTCICPNGYYDNSPNTVICQLCSNTLPNCLLCSNANTCTSCGFGSFYNSGASSCQLCAAQCLSCSGSASTCITCNLQANRSIPPVCGCSTGFSLISSNPGASTCMSCSGTIPNCTLCVFSSTPIDYVVCTLCIAQSCSNCNYKCAACSITNPARCIVCSSVSLRQFSSASNDCVCPQGYFESNVTICGTCDYSCFTCSSGSLFNCLACTPDSTENRINLPVNGQCTCVVGYFDAGMSTCQACSSNCVSCSKNPFFCLSCSPTLYLLDSVCITTCPQGYYTEPSTANCVVCIVGCLICTVEYVCLQCVAPALLFEKSCSLSCPKQAVRKNQNCYLCAPNQVHYNDRCIETCPFQTAVLDSSLLCEPSQSTAFLLNFTYIVQKEDAVYLYFTSTTNVSPNTLRQDSVNVFIDDWPVNTTVGSAARRLQFLTPLQIITLRLLTNTTYELKLASLATPLINRRVRLEVKNLTGVYDLSTNMLSNQGFTFTIDRTIDTNKLPSYNWFRFLGRVLSTLMTLLVVAGLALLEQSLVRESMRLMQTYFYYALMDVLPVQTYFFFNGFAYSHFYWFLNPLLSLLNLDYFQAAPTAFGFSATDMNYFRNCGSQLLLVAVLLGLSFLPAWVLKFDPTGRPLVGRMTINMLRMATYNLIFFGVCQFKSLAMNPTPAYPTVYYASLLTGFIFAFVVGFFLAAKFVRGVWAECKQQEDLKVVYTSSQINLIVIAALNFFQHFNQLLVSVVVVFFPNKNGWLVLLAIQMMYCFKIAFYAVSQNKPREQKFRSVNAINSVLGSVVAMAFCLMAFLETSFFGEVALVGIWALIAISQLFFKIIISAIEKLESSRQNGKDYSFGDLLGYFRGGDTFPEPLPLEVDGFEPKRAADNQQKEVFMDQEVQKVPPTETRLVVKPAEPSSFFKPVQSKVQPLQGYEGGMEELEQVDADEIAIRNARNRRKKKRRTEMD